MEIIVFSLPDCPNCEELKGFFQKRGILFKEKPLDTAESMTEIRIGGVHMMEAPVLRINNKYFASKNIFVGGKLDEEVVSKEVLV